MSDEPTPYNKFKALAKKVISVPKAEIGKRETAYQKARRKRRRRR